MNCRKTVATAVKFPRKLFLAGLGLVGMLPELLKEKVPAQLNDALTETENLYYRAAERGEMMAEQRKS
ncbi:MAG: hypothetical protein R3E31_28415 [Chloroflexota bacterium]|nr:hypothetical protein [Anaerolineales bacterium]MCB8966483.1 hypothetical protein [Ardenticatenaceae bacterium]